MVIHNYSTLILTDDRKERVDSGTRVRNVLKECCGLFRLPYKPGKICRG